MGLSRVGKYHFSLRSSVYRFRQNSVVSGSNKVLTRKVKKSISEVSVCYLNLVP